MKRASLALAGWLLLALPAWAADPAVKAELSGPKAADPGGLFVLNPAGTVAPGGVKIGVLKDAPGPVPITTLKSDDGQVYGLAVAEKPGRYTFFVVAIGPAPPAGKLPDFDFAFWAVQVGQPAPPPDPGPGPGPGPTPPPNPADGLLALIVTETSDLAKLPKSQVTLLTSQVVWDYLRAHCPKGPDGKTPEFRIWDKDVDVSHESVAWQAAFKRPRAQTPWLLLSNPRTGQVYYEGALPATESDMLATLKKFGG